MLYKNRREQYASGDLPWGLQFVAFLISRRAIGAAARRITESFQEVDAVCDIDTIKSAVAIGIS
jgi:hypothetical protein